MEKVNVDLLSNEELRSLLIKHGHSTGPIVQTTRKVYENKLKRILTGGSSGSPKSSKPLSPAKISVGVSTGSFSGTGTGTGTISIGSGGVGSGSVSMSSGTVRTGSGGVGSGRVSIGGGGVRTGSGGVGSGSVSMGSGTVRTGSGGVGNGSGRVSIGGGGVGSIGVGRGSVSSRISDGRMARRSDYFQDAIGGLDDGRMEGEETFRFTGSDTDRTPSSAYPTLFSTSNVPSGRPSISPSSTGLTNRYSSLKPTSNYSFSSGPSQPTRTSTISYHTTGYSPQLSRRSTAGAPYEPSVSPEQTDWREDTTTNWMLLVAKIVGLIILIIFMVMLINRALEDEEKVKLPA